MKIRTGFVSNSSSSSFVCVGFKKELSKLTENEKIKLCRKMGATDEELEQNKEWISDLLHEMFDDSEFNWYSEEDIVGYQIASYKDYYMETTNTTFDEVLVLAKKVADFWEVDIEEVSLLTGEYAC